MLSKEQKQRVLDTAVDLLFDLDQPFKFRYHGYVKNELVEQVTVPEK